MFALSHVAKLISKVADTVMLKIDLWITGIFLWYDSLRVTRTQLLMVNNRTYFIAQLYRALQYTTEYKNDVMYSGVSHALVGLRDYNWRVLPADLEAAGYVRTSHMTIGEAIRRITTLNQAISLTNTELIMYRGDVSVPVFDWLCPKGGWSEASTKAELELYAAKIMTLCADMRRMYRQRPINETQKSNWSVIEQEVRVAINTMLQLYMKL